MTPGPLSALSDWLVMLEGTASGARLAMVLALVAAAAHAVFGALQKRYFDPWLSRGAIDTFFFLFGLPMLLVVPWPEPHLWPLFAGMWAIHTGYKFVLAMAYSRAPFTVVYPVMRGTGPVLTVIGAWLVFGEVFAPLQWLGMAALVTGILGLSALNVWRLQIGRARLIVALAWAMATGGFVALYTVWDAYTIRAVANPFTFLVWFLVLDGLSMPVIAAVRLRRTAERPDFAALARLGALGGVIGAISFWSVMLATRLDEVGEAAVLRETSAVFAALIGWLWLKEPVGASRGALIALIALGAVLVEIGG